MGEEMPRHAWRPTCGPHGVPNDELVIVGLNPACVCYTCYSGSSCQDIDEDCMAGDRDAIVSMNAPWFLHHHAPPMRIGLGFGMPYRGSDVWIHPASKMDALSGALNARIRRLHSLCDNVPGGHAAYRHLILGAGATQLLSAALHARSYGRTGCVATAAAPYWGPFEEKITQAGSAAFWVQRAALNRTTPCVVEFVTRPNNPDGTPTGEPPLPGALPIFDLVYNWPAYGPVVLSSRDAPVAVAIFTASKILGHASSRFGWAFVNDEAIAKRMFEYIWANGRSSTDAQLRHAQTLGIVLDSYRASELVLHESRAAAAHTGGTAEGGSSSEMGSSVERPSSMDGVPASLPLMDWMRAQLIYRWDRLACAIRAGGRLAIASHGWHDDMAMDAGATHRHMFMWLRTRDGSDCEGYLSSIRVQAHGGATYGAPLRFCRLGVGVDRSSFDLVVERIERSNSRRNASVAVGRVRRRLRRGVRGGSTAASWRDDL